MSIQTTYVSMLIFATFYFVFLFWPDFKFRLKQLQKSKAFNRKKPAVTPSKKPDHLRRFYSPRDRRTVISPDLNLKTQLQELLGTCIATKSSMVLLVYDNQEMETHTVTYGNDLDLIKTISEASDEDPAIDEVLQIIAKYYHAKYESQ